MKIFLGTDHAGFEMKELLKKFLISLGHEVEDCGAFSYDPQDDYPDFIHCVAKKVAKSKASKGIVLGGSGQGECMVANKVKRIRAAIAYDEYGVRMSREHNDANILCLAARVLTIEQAKKFVQVWLEREFTSDERHLRRLRKIKDIEEGKFK
mgnify:CR=1 FL=1